MSDRPVLGETALARVTAVFDQDLAALGALLDTPLSCATFKAAVMNKPPEWSINPSVRPTSP